MDELAATLEYARDLRDSYATVITQRSPALPLVLEYEQLYSEDLQRNRATAARVFEFLGCEPLATPQMDDLMDPRRSKLDFGDAHAAVPNMPELVTMTPGGCSRCRRANPTFQAHSRQSFPAG